MPKTPESKVTSDRGSKGSASPRTDLMGESGPDICSGQFLELLLPWSLPSKVTLDSGSAVQASGHSMMSVHYPTGVTESDGCS